MWYEKIHHYNERAHNWYKLKAGFLENYINIVTINLTKAEIAYNSSGSDFNKWLRNTLLLTFITTIYFWLCIDSDQQNIYNDWLTIMITKQCVKEMLS